MHVRVCTGRSGRCRRSGAPFKRGSLMQRILSLVAVAVVSLLELASAHAQAASYQPIRVDSGLSGSYASDSGRGGFGGVVEPKLYVHDNIAVGARVEALIMFG